MTKRLIPPRTTARCRRAAAQALPTPRKSSSNLIRLMPVRSRRSAGRHHESFDKAVALAPQAPDGYRRRARYWRIDRFLLSLLNDLGVKGQSPSTETALAAEYADYRRETDLNPDDAVAVTRIFVIDSNGSEYCDDKWYQKQLRGTGQAAELKPGALMTEKSALAHLDLPLGKRRRESRSPCIRSPRSNTNKPEATHWPRPHCGGRWCGTPPGAAR